MIALLGGTFNPVHYGHIALAREVADHYRLDKVSLLPSHLPVHREEPQVSGELRSRMIELAIAPYPELGLNRIELERGGSSYTVDTLVEIKQQNPRTAICWLLGADAFNGFAGWKNPAKILRLANLIVCARPGVPLAMHLFREHHLAPGEELQAFDAGRIAFFDMQPNPCAATTIRHNLKQCRPVSGCLSQPVIDFIHHHHLYEN